MHVSCYSEAQSCNIRSASQEFQRRTPRTQVSPGVQRALSREILSGKYKPGEKFSSEAALVQQFQTSRITVGRALRELSQRGLVERVAGSGTYVGRARYRCSSCCSAF